MEYNVKTDLVQARNVLGVIEGEIKDEIVVIGGHYDHLGYKDNVMWNGADDNASGTIGVWMLAKAFAASGIKPKRTIVFAAWTGEEIGLRGAQMITETIQPNVAIVTDVTHDTTTPMIDKKVQGHCEMGKGPVIAYAPAVQQKLRDLITDTAEEKKIPFQRAALSRATGTDTDAFAYSNGGVASALISLPLRYMHTTVEMVHRKDVEAVINLIYESLLNMKNNDTYSYFE